MLLVVYTEYFALKSGSIETKNVVNILFYSKTSQNLYYKWILKTVRWDVFLKPIYEANSKQLHILH